MALELKVRLLGSFSLAYVELERTEVHTARLQALLAYLLLHRNAPQARQQLAFLFWPDTTEVQAYTNLRQLLHVLRHRMPEASTYVEVTDKTVRWRADASFTLDVAEFEAALDEACHAEGGARLAALERAVAAYGGDLLPGSYDDWVLLERARLAERLRDALEQLVLGLEQRRDYARAIQYAQRLLRHDPLHEAVYCHLMRLHALTGDRAAALRVYHTCVTALERELGVPPGVETVEAYRSLLDLEHGTPRAPIPPGPAHLVGRQAEWQTLHERWLSLQGGEVHCICLAGEAGIGKTRLAEELLHWAGQQGIATASTRAYAGGGSLAYAPLVELLRSEALRPCIAELPAIWRSELARLLPELLDEAAAPAWPELSSGPRQAQRLYDAVGQVLWQAGQKLILLLDDLQWCDTETLAWLRYLLRPDPPTGGPARSAPRLLVLVGLRPEEVGAEHPVARLLVDLQRSDRLTELALARLSAVETSELASIVAERGLDASHAAVIHGATEGNPLFVVETVRAGLAAATEGGPAPSAVAAPKVQAVIRARLAQLSPPARELAGLAAAMGRSFAHDVLALASEQDEDTLARSLDELWWRRIIREQGANTYDFTHDCLREVAYSDLSPARRRLLHSRLARALEAVHAPDTLPVSAQLAYHYEQAGQQALTIHYLRAAAGHAYRVFAYRESISLLNHALSLLPSLPLSTSRLELELELQMALCTAWASVSDYLGEEVAAAYRRALILCRQVQHRRYLFTVLWGLHEVEVYRGEFRQSLELAQECLRIAEELDDPGLQLEAHHAVWGPHFQLGEYEQAFAHIETGLALYERASHEGLSVQYGVHDAGDCAIHQYAMGLWNRGYVDQALAKLEAAVAFGEQLTLPANIADSCGYTGLLLHLLRDPVRAQAFGETALRISTEKGYPYTELVGQMVLGWSLAAQGRLAEGLALAEQAMAARESAGLVILRSQLAAMLTETCLLAGQYDRAVSAADAGIADFQRYRDLLCAPDLWTLKGVALEAQGTAGDQVEGCYQAALALARELDARICELRAALRLARLRRRQGRPGEGYHLLQAVHSRFSEGFGSVDLREARTLLEELSS